MIDRSTLVGSLNWRWKAGRRALGVVRLNFSRMNFIFVDNFGSKVALVVVRKRITRDKLSEISASPRLRSLVVSSTG